MSKPALLAWLLLAAATPLAAAPESAATEPAAHVAVELVSELTALTPGATAWVGVRLRHAPHWHTYWINPGDSGLPTRLAWTLPEGFLAGAIAWPAPRRLPVGELNNFGYIDEQLLPVPIRVPLSAALDRPVELRVAVRWLECEELCIPGQATLALSLPVQAQVAASDSRWQALFAAARAALPQPMNWIGQARDSGAEIEITLTGTDLPDPSSLDIFAVQTRVIENARPEFQRRDAALVMRVPKSAYFATPPAQLDLVLTTATGATLKAWQISVPFLKNSQP